MYLQNNFMHIVDIFEVFLCICCVQCSMENSCRCVAGLCYYADHTISIQKARSWSWSWSRSSTCQYSSWASKSHIVTLLLISQFQECQITLVKSFRITTNIVSGSAMVTVKVTAFELKSRNPKTTRNPANIQKVKKWIQDFSCSGWYTWERILARKIEIGLGKKRLHWAPVSW